MLTIRSAAETDYAAIVNWNAGKDEAYLFQWAGFTAYQHPLTEEQLSRQAKKEGVTIFMIFENETPIGTAELCDIDKTAKTGRICRVLFAEEARSRGYGTEALQAISRMAFEEMGLVSLSLRVYCFNISAIRCYEKVGFRVAEYFEEKDPHWNNYSMELKK
ncbi:MAG: GNAT family N-acetyltransferase [Anaerotignum sp.]